MLVTAGGGEDVSLSENLLAGMVLSLETPLGGSDKQNTVSLGAHVAYGW